MALFADLPVLEPPLSLRTDHSSALGRPSNKTHQSVKIQVFSVMAELAQTTAAQTSGLGLTE